MIRLERRSDGATCELCEETTAPLSVIASRDYRGRGCCCESCLASMAGNREHSMGWYIEYILSARAALIDRRDCPFNQPHLPFLLL